MPPIGLLRPASSGAAPARRSLARHRRINSLAPMGLAVLLLGLAAPPARASSPDAWAAYDREVRAACRKASQLLQPKVLGERIDVPVARASPAGPTALISALLLEGRHPQPHMRGKMGRELCLFEQRTRRATVAEANDLDRPRPKP